MKQSILFVVPDPKVTGNLDVARVEWDIAMASNSEVALQALGQKEFEAVVADSSIQGREDLSFLAQVQNRYSHVMRILLCDPGDKKALKSDGTFHQYVVKPCTPDTVFTAVERARMVDTWLSDPAMKRLFAQMRKLPSVPAVYIRLVEKLRSPEADLEDIGRILAEDPGMTAKVLQVVNSAVFGLSQPVTSPVEAVAHLGLQRTQALVLLAQAFSASGADQTSSFVDRLWHHSMVTGKLARVIAREESGSTEVAEEAYTAGVLHDVGKLLLAANLPQEHEAVRQRAQHENLPLEEVEKDVLGACHAEVGACVLGIWGLPLRLVETIALHHRPSRHPNSRFCALTAVHLANALEHEMHAEERQTAAKKLDQDYMARMHMADRVDFWREMCKTSG
jgi:HD-like signal output (HDOD) protein